MNFSPVFHIDALPIYGELVLAPLSGYNDQPFRRLCQSFGAALTYTGLLAANAILHGKHTYGNRRTDEMLRLHPAEHPLACQLFGSDAHTLVRAAYKILPLQMDVIDVNLGCAKHKIVRGGAGAALLREPIEAIKVVKELCASVPLPVTAKMRLGWDELDRHNQIYLDLARRLEDSGVAMLAVHGRTAEQGYSGQADWDAIADIKQCLHIPVLGSGDIKCVADTKRMLAHTGCDAVMIGRGAIGNPWIFGQQDRDDIPWSDRLPVVLSHLATMLDFHGDRHGVHRFRKHLRGYLRGSVIPRWYRSQMLVCEDGETLTQMIRASLEMT